MCSSSSVVDSSPSPSIAKRFVSLVPIWSVASCGCHDTMENWISVGDMMIDSPISIPMQMDKSKADKIVFSGPVNDFKRTSNSTLNMDVWEEACLWCLGQVTFLLQVGYDDLSVSSEPCSPGYDFCCSHLVARMTIKPTLRMAEETEVRN